MNVPLLILHKAPKSDNFNTPGSDTPASTFLPARPNEPTPLAPGIESVPVTPGGILMPRAAKRSHETAFGILPPPDHLHETARQATVMPGAEPAAKRSRTAPPDDNERLPLPDLIDGAMSRDDKTAISFISKFFALPIVPGPDFAEFIEGWKILTLHAANRQPPLQGWKGGKVFCEGLSRIKLACTGYLELEEADQDTIRKQMKMQLFAAGTPVPFLKEAERLRTSKPEERHADATLDKSYKNIKAFNLVTTIKAANRRLICQTEDLSCQQRIDAMRTRLAEQAAAAQDLLRPSTAGVTSANVGHTSFKGLLLMLEKNERIGLAQVNSALLEPIQTLEQIASRIRMVQACSIHLSIAANQVDGFDAVALIRLAGVRLERQAAHYRTTLGNDAATRFRDAVKKQVLDANTPHEYIVAAQGARDFSGQPRGVDSLYSRAVLKRGLNLVASAEKFDSFLKSPDWMRKSGLKPYETLITECSNARTQDSNIHAQAGNTAGTAGATFVPIGSIAPTTTTAPSNSTTSTPVVMQPLLRSAVVMPTTPFTWKE